MQNPWEHRHRHIKGWVDKKIQRQPKRGYEERITLGSYIYTKAGKGDSFNELVVITVKFQGMIW